MENYIQLKNSNDQKKTIEIKSFSLLTFFFPFIGFLVNGMPGKAIISILLFMLFIIPGWIYGIVQSKNLTKNKIKKAISQGYDAIDEDNKRKMDMILSLK